MLSKFFNVISGGDKQLAYKLLLAIAARESCPETGSLCAVSIINAHHFRQYAGIKTAFNNGSILRTQTTAI